MSFTLSPRPANTGADSPGSSVFDLPTQPLQPSPTPAGQRRAVAGQSTGLVELTPPDTSFVVISGGTGCNSICSAFGQAACYILPVSDDGGSSSEIIRVLGGPSIGEHTVVHGSRSSSNAVKATYGRGWCGSYHLRPPARLWMRSETSSPIAYQPSARSGRRATSGETLWKVVVDFGRVFQTTERR